MIRRKHRLNFRLDAREWEQANQLMKTLHCYEWTALITLALKRLAEANPPRASDNGVIHAEEAAEAIFARSKNPVIRVKQVEKPKKAVKKAKSK